MKPGAGIKPKITVCVYSVEASAGAARPGV